MFFLAAMYSSIVPCTSKWFGVTLVTTAISGLCRIESSWNEESSTTAMSSGFTVSSSGNSARPMLPPKCTVLPLCRSISAIRLVVVVLPSLPVTPMMGQGQHCIKSSSSLVTAAPAFISSFSRGWLKYMPGVRKITSPRSFCR